jgi:hypothetical protein
MQRLIESRAEIYPEGITSFSPALTDEIRLRRVTCSKIEINSEGVESNCGETAMQPRWDSERRRRGIFSNESGGGPPQSKTQSVCRWRVFHAKHHIHGWQFPFTGARCTGRLYKLRRHGERARDGTGLPRGRNSQLKLAAVKICIPADSAEKFFCGHHGGRCQQ